jgi:hypothetical protein
MKKIIFVFAIVPFIIGAIFTYHNAHSAQGQSLSNNTTGATGNSVGVSDDYFGY